MTINDTVMDYVDEITTILSGVTLMQPVKYNEVRFTTDIRNESIGKKVREATVIKIPTQIIVGPRDKAARAVSVRTRKGEEQISIDQLASYIQNIQ